MLLTNCIVLDVRSLYDKSTRINPTSIGIRMLNHFPFPLSYCSATGGKSLGIFCERLHFVPLSNIYNWYVAAI